MAPPKIGKKLKRALTAAALLGTAGVAYHVLSNHRKLIPVKTLFPEGITQEDVETNLSELPADWDEIQTSEVPSYRKSTQSARGIQPSENVLEKHLGKGKLLHEIVGSDRLQSGAGLASHIAKSITRLPAQAKQKLISVGEHLVKTLRPTKKTVPKAAALFAASLGAALAHRHRNHLQSIGRNLIRTHVSNPLFSERFKRYEAGLQQMVIPATTPEFKISEDVIIDPHIIDLARKQNPNMSRLEHKRQIIREHEEAINHPSIRLVTEDDDWDMPLSASGMKNNEEMYGGYAALAPFIERHIGNAPGATHEERYANTYQMWLRQNSGRQMYDKPVVRRSRAAVSGDGIKSKLKKAAMAAGVALPVAAAFLAALQQKHQNRIADHNRLTLGANKQAEWEHMLRRFGSSEIPPPYSASGLADKAWATTKNVLKSAAKYAGVSLLTATAIAALAAREANWAFNQGYRIAHVSNLNQPINLNRQRGRGAGNTKIEQIADEANTSVEKAEKVIEYLQQHSGVTNGAGLGKQIKKGLLKTAAFAAGISLPVALVLVKHLVNKRKAKQLETDLYKDDDESNDLMHEAEDALSQEQLDKELTYIDPAALSAQGLRGGSIEAIAGKKLRPQAEKFVAMLQDSVQRGNGIKGRGILPSRQTLVKYAKAAALPLGIAATLALSVLGVRNGPDVLKAWGPTIFNGVSQVVGQLEKAGTHAKRQIGKVEQAFNKAHDSVLSVKPPVEIEMKNMAAAGVKRGKKAMQGKVYSSVLEP